MIPEIGSDLIQCLRGFYYSARLGSLTAAAAKMGRNQSALTHQIKFLEQMLGAKLFTGDKRNRKLTIEGEFLLRKSIALFELIKETKDGVAQISESLKGKISIFTYHAVLLHFLPKYVTAFKSKYPLVNFVLEGASEESILAKVSFAECDFGIGTYDNLRPGLIADPLFKTRLVLITPRQGPLAIDHRPSLEEISPMPMVAFTPQSTIRPFIQRLFANNGLSLNIIQELNHVELIKKYTELGMGVSLLYDYALTDFDKNNLNVQLLDFEVPERIIGIIRRRDMHISPHIAAFLAMLKEQGERS